MKFLNIMWKKIEELFKENFEDIFMISIFNFFLYGINRHFYGRFVHSPFFIKLMKFSLGYIEFLTICIGIGVIFSFFGEKIKNIFFKIIKYISFIIFITEFFLFINFKSIINPGIIQILLETNKNESIDFVREYLKLKDILYLIILFFIIQIFYKILIKKINIDRVFKIKFLRIVLILFILISIFNIRKNFNKTGVGRLYYSIREATNNIKEYKDLESKINSDIRILENNSKIKNIVFILGESTTRNHMSLYNYKENTNPLLKKIEKEGKLYKFENTISPHSHTIDSLKKVLTFFNYEQDKKWYENNNIIDIMKKSGYKTYWYSNQESSGIYGNVAVAIGKRSDILVFNRLRDSGTEGTQAYDEEIIDKSLKILSKDDADKKFIIYHLMGAHARYLNRYPSNFNVFTENLNEKINEYDNAVLYNDYVINKIISNFSNEESIIIYISDHGEEIYDFRDFFGHSETNASRYMLEIPFIIYTSDKFKNKYPEKIKNIENSLKNPYMTDDIIHTILDIADIKTEEYDETRSVINPKFNKERKRIFNGKDYDTYWKNLN